MPYGTIADNTREYVEQRAKESGVSLDKLGIETSDEVTISVIYEGALDEEFDMAYHYAANVADWIAEDLSRLDGNWTVTVTQYGETVYSVSSDD